MIGQLLGFDGLPKAGQGRKIRIVNITQQRHSIDHIGGAKGNAILPFDIFAQLDHIFQAVTGNPYFGRQAGNWLAIGIRSIQALEYQACDVIVNRVEMSEYRV